MTLTPEASMSMTLFHESTPFHEASLFHGDVMALTPEASMMTLLHEGPSPPSPVCQSRASAAREWPHPQAPHAHAPPCAYVQAPRGRHQLRMQVRLPPDGPPGPLVAAQIAPAFQPPAKGELSRCQTPSAARWAVSPAR